MTTASEATGARAAVAKPRPGTRHPIVDSRTVFLDVFTDSDQGDVPAGMRPFSPVEGELHYSRVLRDGVWSPWRCTVRLAGPRRLSSGALGSTRCEATFRTDAAEGSLYAVPTYLRPHIAQWHPEVGEPSPYGQHDDLAGRL